RWFYLNPRVAKSDPGNTQLVTARYQWHAGMLAGQGLADAPFHSSYPEEPAGRHLRRLVGQVATKVVLPRTLSLRCITASQAEDQHLDERVHSRAAKQTETRQFRDHRCVPQCARIGLWP